MKLREIVELVNAKEVFIDSKDVYDYDFAGVFATDLMSDALCNLRDAEDTRLLITGLANMQIVHTANTLDLPCVMIVRGKTLDNNLINGAKINGISIFVTDLDMYEACGLLFEKGLGR